ALRERHQTVRGLRHRLAAVRRVGGDAKTVQLEVAAALGGHEIDGPGGARQAIAAGPPMVQHLTLIRTRAGWRVAAVII
ncbi:MAG: hypothetical protein JWN31_1121, partial [Frankiales bacterium]|nr:hypothetical protein [Frankiales bacterium]